MLQDSAIVPFLYRSGFMKLCAQDSQGNTLLHTSLQTRNQSITSSILNFMIEEADHSSVSRALNLQNCDGDTPLHIAARVYPDSRLIMELISLGAKLGIPNKENKVVDFDENISVTTPDTQSTLSLSSGLLTPDWEKEIGTPPKSTSTSVPPGALIDNNNDKAPIPVPTDTPVKDGDANYSSTSSDSKLPDWLTIAEKPPTPPLTKIDEDGTKPMSATNNNNNNLNNLFL
jgi:ankyrin repeat protein